MTTEPWGDVLAAAHWSARHFERASRILERPDFDIQQDEGYANSMAFFHAMQLGHTAFEEALIRTLHILDEDRPSGDRWHAELILQCASTTDSRPAIITQELATAAHQTRLFRHRAAQATVQFDFVFNKERARIAAKAGEAIAATLEPAILHFMNAGSFVSTGRD